MIDGINNVILHRADLWIRLEGVEKMQVVKPLYEKVRRIFLTLVCIAQFVLQALWLGKWVVPRIMRRRGVSLELRNLAHQTIHKHVHIYVKKLFKFQQLKLKVIGKPLKNPCIVAANHPTLFDYIALLLGFPNAVCVYKSEALQNPVLAPLLKTSGYIEDGDGSRELMTQVAEKSYDRLREKQHVIVFPELSRSMAALKLGNFRLPVFHAASEINAPVQPVAIWCEPMFLGKGQSWLTFANPENKMVVSFLPPIVLKNLPPEQRNAKGMAQATRAAIETELQRLEGMLVKK